MITMPPTPRRFSHASRCSPRRRGHEPLVTVDERVVEDYSVSARLDFNIFSSVVSILSRRLIDFHNIEAQVMPAPAREALREYIAPAPPPPPAYACSAMPARPDKELRLHARVMPIAGHGLLKIATSRLKASRKTIISGHERQVRQ